MVMVRIVVVWFMRKMQSDEGKRERENIEKTYAGEEVSMVVN